MSNSHIQEINAHQEWIRTEIRAARPDQEEMSAKQENKEAAISANQEKMEATIDATCSKFEETINKQVKGILVSAGQQTQQET
jgi:ribosome recycling factor